jgi:hypothetical protein
MTCAFFASHYDIYGSTNAGANVEFSILKNTAFKSSTALFSSLKQQNIWSGWTDSSAHNSLEAAVNNKDYSSITQFVKDCDTLFRRRSTK